MAGEKNLDNGMLSEENLDDNILSEENSDDYMLSEENLDDDILCEENLDDDMLSSESSDKDVLSEENLDDDMLNVLSEENWDDNMLIEENSEESFDIGILNEVDDILRESNSVFDKDGSDRKIVDKPLNAEKMPSINGEFAPYFKNIIEALIVCWIKKHNICQEVAKNYELWYSKIWKESPKFGCKSVTIGKDFVVYRESTKRIGCILSIVQKDGSIKINIQRALTFEELPINLQSNNHKERSLNSEKPDNNENNANEDKYIKISLKKRIPQKNIEESILSDLKAQLELFYEDLGYSFAAWNNLLSFFEYANFLVEENGTFIQCRLHIGDVVSINSDEEDESFSIIHSIFCDRKDEHNITFIIINWFENTNQMKLGCLVYRLHTTNKWRRIFLIGVVNAVSTVHFVHNCKNDECIKGNHNLANDLYLRNLYFFKPI
ncbi:14091_t:CDS:2 [Dentiscutata erythropus]|uniref:14091_t:CDS:1 n=1 Tax=Dentiscutata erythropus TaxID=1348616 RepID=A0A9N9AAE6_9GLOM|nr:14091_t:CDS:2 [Dentiscutata erythropus]